MWKRRELFIQFSSSSLTSLDLSFWVNSLNLDKVSFSLPFVILLWLINFCLYRSSGLILLCTSRFCSSSNVPTFIYLNWSRSARRDSYYSLVFYRACRALIDCLVISSPWSDSELLEFPGLFDREREILVANLLIPLLFFSALLMALSVGSIFFSSSESSSIISLFLFLSRFSSLINSSSTFTFSFLKIGT